MDDEGIIGERSEGNKFQREFPSGKIERKLHRQM
jgi:hypothetical protein